MKRAQLAKRVPIATEIKTDANGVVYEEVLDAQVTTTTATETITIVETITVDKKSAIVQADIPLLSFLFDRIPLLSEIADVMDQMSPIASDIAALESAPLADAEAIAALQ